MFDELFENVGEKLYSRIVNSTKRTMILIIVLGAILGIYTMQQFSAATGLICIGISLLICAVVYSNSLYKIAMCELMMDVHDIHEKICFGTASNTSEYISKLQGYEASNAKANLLNAKPEESVGWICANCGNENKRGQFCSKCGTKNLL